MTEKMTCAHCLKDYLSHYYTTLCQEPHNLHRFYGPTSIFKHGCLDTNGKPVEAVVGQVNIHEQIMALGFQNCHPRIRSITAQDTFSNSVTVLVTGDLSINEQPMRGFIQLLVLAPSTGNTKYIHSDVLQYQDEVFGNPELEVDFTEEKADILLEPQPVAEEPSVMSPTPSPAAIADPDPSALESGQGVEQTEDEKVVASSELPKVEECVASSSTEPDSMEMKADIPLVPQPDEDPSSCAPNNLPLCDTNVNSEARSEAVETEVRPAVEEVKTDISQKRRAFEEPTSHTSPSTIEGSPTLDSTVKAETESGPKPEQKGKTVGKSETQLMEVTTQKSSPQMSWAAVARSVPPPNMAVKSTPALQPKNKNSRPAQDGRKGGFKPCMFVGNIPTDVEDAELKEFFEQYGTVLKVRTRTGKNSRYNFGFVEFEDPELARSIIDCKYVQFRPKIYLRVGEDRAATTTIHASTEPDSMEMKTDIPLVPQPAEDPSLCAPNNLPLGDKSVNSEAGSKAEETELRPAVEEVKMDISQEHRVAEASSDPTSLLTIKGSPSFDSAAKPETQRGSKPVQEAKTVGESETQLIEVTTQKSSPQMSWAAVARSVPPPNMAVKSTPRTVVAPQPKHKNSRPAQVKPCMFVGNIPTDVEEAELKEFFEQYGTVLKVRTRTGKNSRYNFGFVEFEDPELARSIIDCKYVQFRPKIYLSVGEDRAATTTIHGQRPTRVR